MNLINKKSVLCFIVAAMMIMTTVMPLVACTQDNTVYYDNETNPLVFSSQDVDKVFNPFFSTTAPDSNVIGPTQVGMLSNDSKGKVAYGDTEAVVVKDYEEKTYEEGGKQYTNYKFVLKRDIKFSNGSPLTIKDVLFNMYVYLDPAYTGSSTMYSTDIVGLKAYRTQTYDEKEQEQYSAQFERKANTRILALVTATNTILKDTSVTDEVTFAEKLAEYRAANKNAQYVVDDFNKAIELFNEELDNDYKNSVDTWQDFVLRNKNGQEVTSQNGKKLIANDNEMFLYNEGKIKWDKNADNGNGKMDYGDYDDRDYTASMTKEDAIKSVYLSIVPSQFAQVITGWQTAGNLFDYIVNDEMEKDIAQKGKTVPNISGITFANKDASVNVNGEDYPAPEYNDDGSVKSSYEVLSITINKVDPKAIWNFSFTVAPMYYYSTTSWAKEGGTPKNYIEAFNFENEFGVEFNSQTFMTQVVKNSDKIGVPVGAGPYVASKSTGGTENVTAGDFCKQGVIYYERNVHYNFEGASVPKIKNMRYKIVSEQQMLNSLYQKDIHYAEPNAKPEKMSELDKKKGEGFGHTEVETSGYGYIGINAGKVPSIKARQAIMHAMNTELAVQYYDGKAEAIYRSMSKSSWAYPEGCTPYYPYIGSKISASVFNDNAVVNPDYKEFVLYKNKQAGDTFTFDEQKEFIYGLLTKNGWSSSGNPWVSENHADYVEKNGVLTNDDGALKYVFTIAGETDDHPAFNTLYQASQLLNQMGFDTYTTTDSNALSKLSTGDLTVWAAAWGSTIDPDMYQVYHIDSKATSVLNWGYKQIKINQTKYATEMEIINELSTRIEQGRSTTDQNARSGYYKDALDLVMQLAVELPTYQRQDMFAYNERYIDVNTFNKDLSSYKGLTSDINLLSLVVKEK